MKNVPPSEPSPFKAKILRRILRVFLAGLAVLVPAFLVFVFILYQQAERMVTRHYSDTAQDIFLEIRQELEDFGEIGRDHGLWNGAFQFLRKTKRTLADTDFADESARRLRIDFILLLDPSRKIVLLKGFDMNESARRAFLTAIENQIATHPEWSAPALDVVRKGFEELGGQVYMVGIGALKESGPQGPSVGTIVFGRSLHRFFGSRFRGNPNRAFSVHMPRDASLPADVRSGLETITRSGLRHATQSRGDRMVCYLAVEDLHGVPCFILRMEETSLLPNLFKQFFWLMSLGILIVGTISCAITILTIRRTVSQTGEQHQRDIQTLLDGLPAYAFFKDAEGRYVMANRRFCEAVGRPPSEIVGRDDFELFPAALAERRRADDRKVIATGETLLIDEEILDRGRPLSISVRKVPLKDENQTVIGIIGAGFDVTERKQGELALQESHRRLTEEIAERKKTEDRFRQVQKMEAVGRLAGGVAHDFNNLLLVISGYAEFLLKEFPVGHPRRKTVEEIQRATARATTLTQQLLAFSRKQVVQPRILNLNQVVVEVESMLHRLIGEDIKLTLRCATTVGFVNADPGQIQQVIMNLAINARDAMMPNGGTLTLKTANIALDEGNGRQFPGVPEGDYVVLIVQDEGCGMTDEVKAHLFEPFFTTKEPGKGTGLGLSTVYGIVQQANGFIHVQSEVNEGTTFIILLPEVDRPATAELPEQAKEEVLGGSEAIFVVEDEESVRDYVSDILGANGYQVFLASNGNDAMKLYRERHFHFDLLLSDIVMPGLKGEEIASFLQTLCPDIRIILMSGYTDERITGPATKQHGYYFLAKPFKPDDLLKLIRKALDNPPPGE